MNFEKDSIPQITENEMDAIKELILVGIGQAANTIGMMLSKRVYIQIPDLFFAQQNKFSEIVGNFGAKLAIIEMDFSGGLVGKSSVIFSHKSASNFVSALIPECSDPNEIDSLKSTTLIEIGNIILNNIMGSIGNILQIKLDYNVPFYEEISQDYNSLLSSKYKDFYILMAHTRVQVTDLHISCDIILVLNVNSIKKLISSVNDMV